MINKICEYSLSVVVGLTAGFLAVKLAELAADLPIVEKLFGIK
jgi:hypothetical protein